MNQGQNNDLSPILAGLIILALMIIQVCLMLNTFVYPGDFFGPGPVLNDDFSVQYYWSHSIRRIFQTSGALWAWDPYFMGGYPLDHLVNTSAFLQVFSLLTPFLDPAWAQKSFYLMVLILVPPVIFLSLSALGISRYLAILGCILGVLLFHTDLTAVMGNAGMVTGLFISYLFLLPFTMYVVFLKEGGWWLLMILIVILPLTFMVHKTSVIILGIPLIFAYLINLHRTTLDRHIATWALVFIVVAINLFWIHPVVRLYHYKIELPFAPFWLGPGFSRPIRDFLGIGTLSGTTITRLALVLSALIGIVKGRTGLYYRISLLSGSVFLFILAYAGHLIPLVRVLSPYRYLTAAYFFLIPLACEGLSRLNIRMGNLSKRAGGLVFLGAFFSLIFIGFCLPSFRHLHDEHPLTTRMPLEGKALINWIKDNTTRDARVLIEDSGVYDREGYGHHYFFMHYPALLPAYTGREFIGGPHPYYYISHSYAGFRCGILFGTPIEGYSKEELEDKMKLYNIGWAIVWSSRSLEVFNSLPDIFSKEWETSLFSVYRVNIDHSYFLKGGGRVQADYNLLELKDIIAEEGEVVLKYHWLETLRAKPPITMVSDPVKGDPAGFIKVVSPPGEFKIYNSYQF